MRGRGAALCDSEAAEEARALIAVEFPAVALAAAPPDTEVVVVESASCVALPTAEAAEPTAETMLCATLLELASWARSDTAAVVREAAAEGGR